MDPNLIKVLVTSPTKDYMFKFRIHHSVGPGMRRVEPGFYLKYCGAKLLGDHHEVEILEPSLRGFKAGLVHYHTSLLKTGGDYICWTGHLPKFSHAMIIIENWTGGAVHAMETGIDFKETFQRHGSEIMRMKDVMEKEYGIKVQILK